MILLGMGKAFGIKGLRGREIFLGFVTVILGTLRPSSARSRRLPSSEAASGTRLFFRQALFETCAYSLVRENRASVDLRQALFHFPDEPVVVINKRFDGGAGQGLDLNAALSGKASELGFHVRRQVDFHTLSLAE